MVASYICIHLYQNNIIHSRKGKYYNHTFTAEWGVISADFYSEIFITAFNVIIVLAILKLGSLHAAIITLQDFLNKFNLTYYS